MEKMFRIYVSGPFPLFSASVNVRAVYQFNSHFFPSSLFGRVVRGGRRVGGSSHIYGAFCLPFLEGALDK